MSDTAAAAYPMRSNEELIASAIKEMSIGLSRLSAGLATLSQLVSPQAAAEEEFDPKDPANKYEVGGEMKLTERGVEICYRLFDQGKSRYAVSQAMGISYGAANHRLQAWTKAGGPNRERRPL